MQRSHAGTTLTFLQPRALTMLPKHNILNIIYKIRVFVVVHMQVEELTYKRRIQTKILLHPTLYFLLEG
jgi:hypothetical protein